MGTKNNNIPGTVIRVDEVNHGNEKRTRLVFGYNAEIIKKVKQIPGDINIKMDQYTAGERA